MFAYYLSTAVWTVGRCGCMPGTVVLFLTITVGLDLVSRSVKYCDFTILSLS